MFTKKRVATTITTSSIIVTRPQQPSWWTIVTRQQQQQQYYQHQQQHQHRYRSTISSNDEGRSTIKTKKHSRKRKLLNAPSSHALPVVTTTTKDRIRLLWETNQLPATNHRFQGTGLAVAPAQDLLDVATSRMTYVRQSIYQYWNPDYNNNKNSDTSTASSSSSSPPRQVRTYKTGLVIMDTRWWIWNVLFSLLPAAIITIYCELRGKHQMYAFHHRLEVEQLQQILGEEDFTVERANAIIAARNKERDELEAWGGGDLDEQAYRYVKNVITTVVATTQMILLQLWNQYVATNNDHDIRDDEEKKDDDHHHIDGNTNHSPESIVRTVETIPPGPDQPYMKGTTPTVEKTPIKSDTLTNDSPPAPKSSNENDNNGVVVNLSIEYIIQRIEQIEERLRQQQQIEQQPQQPSVSTSHDAAVDREEENKEAIRIIAQRMKRMNQSDIHNRFEIAEKEKWKKYIGKVVENDPVGTEQKNKEAPPQLSSPDPSDTTTNTIELVWSRYGAPLWHAMSQSWTDRLNGGDDDDANESTPPKLDPPFHCIEPPLLSAPRIVAVDRNHVSTTTTTTSKDLERIPPHGAGGSRTGAATTTDHDDVVKESTDHHHATTTTAADPFQKPWWKFV